jgi:hypothetical protein
MAMKRLDPDSVPCCRRYHAHQCRYGIVSRGMMTWPSVVLRLTSVFAEQLYAWAAAMSRNIIPRCRSSAHQSPWHSFLYSRS